MVTCDLWSPCKYIGTWKHAWPPVSVVLPGHWGQHSGLIDTSNGTAHCVNCSIYWVHGRPSMELIPGWRTLIETGLMKERQAWGIEAGLMKRGRPERATSLKKLAGLRKIGRPEEERQAWLREAGQIKRGRPEEERQAWEEERSVLRQRGKPDEDWQAWEILASLMKRGRLEEEMPTWGGEEGLMKRGRPKDENQAWGRVAGLRKRDRHEAERLYRERETKRETYMCDKALPHISRQRDRHEEERQAWGTEKGLKLRDMPKTEKTGLGHRD